MEEWSSKVWKEGKVDRYSIWVTDQRMEECGQMGDDERDRWSGKWKMKLTELISI